MTCASCGTPLPENAMFCPGCGQRMLMPRRAAVAAPPVHGDTASAAGARPVRPTPEALPRDEVQAALDARRELGERMEPEIVEAFLSRVERAIDARVEERLDRRLPSGRGRRAGGPNPVHFTGRLAASLGLGIPLTAVAGEIGGAVGVLAVWASIVVLNVFYTQAEKDAMQQRRD